MERQLELLYPQTARKVKKIKWQMLQGRKQGLDAWSDDGLLNLFRILGGMWLAAVVQGGH